MFKKLKEKITEEVKSSPQRLQQFTQSVSDRLQNSAQSDENFFSIADDDSNTSGVDGFSSVSLHSPQENKLQRHNSNSSLASDVSFLPRYESSPMYHLQSDLDVSASEIEDNASTSSQLGHLSKEQIYSAFQKSQIRYHKYRGRYTDLAKHYKELEREVTKMKSVLGDTQDKAIRRITELKEQCALEQKAKAHLESALRDDIDEKQFKIQTLETKIQLLGANNQQQQQQVQQQKTENGESWETLTKYLNDARQEIETLNGKLQESKANTIIFQTKESEYKQKIQGLENSIAQFSEREKENNLILAQNKMDLHNEILMKETEINNLKKENDLLKQNFEFLESQNQTTGNAKMENLQTQNKKLIEKLETATQKCNQYEKELLKIEQLRVEIRNLTHRNDELKGVEEEKNLELQRVREDARNALLNLEEKVQSRVTEEFQQKEAELKTEFEKKLEEIQRSDSKDGLKELEIKIMEKDEFIKQLEEIVTKYTQDIEERSKNYRELEENHLKLIEESNDLRNQVNGLKQESAGTENKISRLKSNISTLEEELANSKSKIKELSNRLPLEEVIQKLEDENKKLREIQTYAKTLENKIAELESVNNQKELIVQNQSKLEERIEALQLKNQTLEATSMEDKEKHKLALEETLKQLEGIRQDLSNTREIVLKLEEEKKEAQERISQLSEENSKLINVQEQLQVINSQLENKVEKLSTNYNEVQQTENQKYLILVEEKQNLDETLLKLQNNYTELEKRYTATSSEFGIEKQQLQSDIEELQNKNVKLQAMQNQKSDELINSKNEISKLIELENEKRKRLEVDKATLENRIQNLELEHSKLIDEQNLRLSQLASEKLTLEESIKNITDDRNQLIHQLNEQDQAIERELDVKRQNEIVENQKIAEFSHKIETLIEENSETMRQFHALQLEKEKLDGLIKALQTAKLELETNENQKQNLIIELEQKISMLTEQQNSTTDELQLKLQQLQNENQKFVDERVALSNKLTAVQTKLKENKVKAQTTAEQIVDLEAKLAKSEEDYKQKLNELENTEKAATKNDVMLKEYESKILTLEETIQKLEAEKKDVEAGKLHLQEKLEEEVLKLKIKLEDAEKEKTILEAELRKTESEVDERTKRLEAELELKMEGEQLKQSKAELEERLQGLEFKLAEKQSVIEVKETEIKQLKAEYNLKFQEVSANFEEQSRELARIHEQSTLSQNNNSNLETKIVSLEQDNSKLKEEIEKNRENINNLQERNSQITTDNKYLTDENQNLIEEVEGLKLQIEQNSLNKNDTTKLTTAPNTMELETENQRLRDELAQSIEDKKQILELERHLSELNHEKQLLQDEIQELKTQPINYSNQNQKLDNVVSLKQEKYVQEIESLRDKLTQYRSLDLTNRSSIEFYENELQKLKNQNEKLNRKLDETLVTLGHCAELSNSTEIEYLRNVLYNYMLGKESLVLARVIAAVCKFDAQQTETILAKEQQKQSLLGQLGIL